MTERKRLIITEALTPGQRAKLRQRARRIQPKLKRGAKRAKVRTADKSRLERRAARRVRRAFMRKRAGGRALGGLSVGRKQSLEKMATRRKSFLKIAAKRELPKARKRERDRRAARSRRP